MSNSPMKPKRKIKSLDGFRGIAAILVVLTHSPFTNAEAMSTFVTNSGLFVEFFFILSGFVMAYSYVQKIDNQLGFRSFIKSRYARLYPLHLFTLVLWIPYIYTKWVFYSRGIGLTDPLIKNNVKTFFSNLFLIHSLGVDKNFSWNGPSWSVSSEFYTYIVFFLAVWLTRKAAFRKQILALLTLVFFYLLYTLNPGRYLRAYDLGVLRCCAGFFLGVVLFYINRKAKSLNIPALPATFLEAGFVAAIYFAVINYTNTGLSYGVLVAVFSSVILFYSLQNNGYISRLLEKEAFQFMGKISYSVYLMHTLIMAGASNICVYLLKIPYVSEELKVIDLSWYSLLVNAILIAIITGISHLTYKHIEMNFHKKILKLNIREILKRKKAA